MSSTETQRGPRTSYGEGVFHLSHLKTPRNGYEFMMFKGVTDFTNLSQFNLFETGYGLLICIEVPKFIQMLANKNDEIRNLLDIYIKTIESEFKSLSGLNSYSVESNPISDGIVEISPISKVTFEASGTFSMPYMEKSGSPLSRFHEIVLRGIKDPRSEFKTYFGELEADYSLEAGFEKECFSFLYLITDNTGRELERAIYFTGCQPQSAPFSELFEITKGTIDNPEISLEYSYHMVESEEINKIALSILDWQNNDLNKDMIIKNSYQKQFKAVDSLRAYNEKNTPIA